MALLGMYNSYFEKLSLHDVDARSIYLNKIECIKKLGQKSDEVRTSVNFIIDTLENAYRLTKSNDSEIAGGMWEKNFYYVFDPIKKPLFVDAFKKKKEEYARFDQPTLNEFVAYVDLVIKENEEKHKIKNKEELKISA